MYLTIEEARLMHAEAWADKSDEQLERLLALYSGIVDEYCNTRFAPTRSEFTADIARSIRLPKGPLLHVDSITCKGDALTEGMDYDVYPEKGLVELADSAAFEKKKRALHICYQYGYQEAPAIVKKVILDLMSLDAQSGTEGLMLAQENWDNEYSYQRNTNKTAEDIRDGILALLDIFRQPQYKPIIQGYGDVRARLF